MQAPNLNRKRLSGRGILRVCGLFPTSSAALRGILERYRSAASVVQRGILERYRSADSAAMRGILERYRSADSAAMRGILERYRSADSAAMRGILKDVQFLCTVSYAVILHLIGIMFTSDTYCYGPKLTGAYMMRYSVFMRDSSTGYAPIH